MDIQFLIDNLTRDLTVSTAAAELLQNPSRTARFEFLGFLNRGHDYDFFERLPGTSDLHITPSYNVLRMRSQFARAVHQNAAIVLNHAEPFFHSAVTRDKLNTNTPRTFNRHVVGHLVLGDELAGALLSRSRTPPDRIFVTGSPQLDLARRVAKRQEPDPRPTALVVSNFKAADLDDTEWRRFARQYQVDASLNFHRFYREARQRCVAWVAKAADRFPGVQFLVRPHPGESSAAYEPLKRLHNVTLTGREDFSVDASRANVAFVYTSTTVLELLVMGKPVYNLALIPPLPELERPHFELFHWLDEAEFQEMLQALKRDGSLPWPEDRRKTLNHYVDDPFGPSLVRFAAAIDELCRRQAATDKPRYAFGDRVLGRVFLLEPLLKHLVIAAAFHAEHRLGIQTNFSRRSREAYEAFKQDPRFLSSAAIDKAQRQACALLTPEERRIVQDRTYRLRPTPRGIYVELPDRLENEDSPPTTRPLPVV